jgi:hypothetical protein
MHAHSEDETGVHHPVVGSERAAVTASAAAGPPGNRWKAIRDTAGAVIGTVLGVAPHVLHHIGLLAGAALITGTSGNALFYAIGLLFSVPMLRRLHRHFATPWAPALAVVVFTGLFSLSAFVIGSAISGTDDTPQPSVPSEPSPSPTDEHGH